MIKRFLLCRLSNGMHATGHMDFDLDRITSLQDRYRKFDYPEEKWILGQIADVIIEFNNCKRDRTLCGGYIIGDDDNFDENIFNECNSQFLQKAASMGCRNAIDELIILNSEDISKEKYEFRELKEKYKDVVKERDNLKEKLKKARIILVAVVLTIMVSMAIYSFY